MRGTPHLLATAVFLTGIASGFAAQTPATVARQALAAWSSHDPVALRTIAHPELLRRCREAEIIRSYLASQRVRENKLVAIAEGRQTKPVPPDVGPSTSDDEAMALFCQALGELDRRNPRLIYTESLSGPETMVVGDLALLVFASHRKSKTDPGEVSSSRTEVLLRKHDGVWRFLWSTAVQTYVDPRWDARKELFAPVKIISDGGTSVTILGVKTASNFRETSLQLPRGVYDVVGKRRGYRDVEALLFVSDDLRPVTLSVACSIRNP